MSGSPRGESPRAYKDDTHDATDRGSADTDIDLEEAQLLLREEFDFQDNDFSNQPSTGRSPGCLGFLAGPRPPRPQKIEPYFRSIQEGTSRLLNRLLPRSEYQSLFLNVVLVVWLFFFIGLLTTELPAVDGSGKYVVNLDCTDSLWKRKNECGVDGMNCHPFSNKSFAFRCPPKCADVQLLNPHAVGAYDANYRPLVVGSEKYRGDSFICASAIHYGIVTDRSGGCGRINLVGEDSGFESTTSHGIKSIPFDSEFPLSFSFTSAKEDGFKCSSGPQSALIVSLLATVVLSLFSSKSKIFFPILVIIFAHVSFVSDPPRA